MGNFKGAQLELALFGESHGEAIGMVISGFPAGVEIDLDALEREMERRRPGGQKGVTERQETDQVRMVSGLRHNKTTGAPICGLIENKGQKSKDYEGLKGVFRPSHVDYSAFVKYGAHWDNRGSGQFSGRLTAPMVFAGALCKQVLGEQGISIHSKFLQVGPLENCQVGDFELEELLEGVKASGDSVGAVVETLVTGIPAGLCGPDFDSLEGILAKALFAIPGLKGVSFGTGFELGKMKGSEANDPFVIENGKIQTASHHSGGVLGGITIGTPIKFQTVFKPTASIKRPQQTIDHEGNPVTLQIEGRHDPCIGIRGLPVVEAIGAVVFLDLILAHNLAQILE